MHFWRSPLSGSAISKIVSPPRSSLIVQIHGAPSVPAEGGRSLLPLHGLGRSIRGPGVGHAAQRRAGQRKVRAVRFWLPLWVVFYLAVRLWLLVRCGVVFRGTCLFVHTHDVTVPKALGVHRTVCWLSSILNR